MAAMSRCRRGEALRPSQWPGRHRAALWFKKSATSRESPFLEPPGQPENPGIDWAQTRKRGRAMTAATWTILPTPERELQLKRLGDEIAELAAHLDAATARLLDLIREFDVR